MHFHALTSFSRPGLHVWRPGTNVRRFVAPVDDTPDDDGWFCFECRLDDAYDADVKFELYQRNEDDSPSHRWEDDQHNRTLPRCAGGRFPRCVWFSQGSGRVLVDDPMANALDTVRIHLITAKRYWDGKLLIWTPNGGSIGKLSRNGVDDIGPFWDVDLRGQFRHLFNFKFLRVSSDGGERFEPDYANRVYSSTDGCEIWTHSEGLEIASTQPLRKELAVYLKQEGDTGSKTKMHLWQESSDWSRDLTGVPVTDGWTRYNHWVYTGLAYRFKFRNDRLDEHLRWEHDEATRTAALDEDREFWTLEGDRHLFDAPPSPNRRVVVRVSHRPPGSRLSDPIDARVWIDRAQAPIHDRVAADVNDPTRFEFMAYPNVTISFQFTDGQRSEDCYRHSVYIDDETESVERSVVLDRCATLREPPPVADLFQDPPFHIRRPGVYEEDGQLRFVLHAPDAARARVAGQWTSWLQNAVEMRSTRDGSYWWATVSVDDVESNLPAAHGASYHGAKYKFLLDDDRWVQDPAAAWVEQSSTRSNSQLVKPSNFTWHDDRWQIPSWDYLTVYQIHPKRFSDRFPDVSPLEQAAREIDDVSGYLHDLGITAILLMPVNEVGSGNSWGYDPAYFYAVERDYGGPDALKKFVDTCHRHGIAVLLDVVFNHSGNDDNILWQVARCSFFDGDTEWGAMINFDHPQCRHFFEQNLVYWQREFHVDGFRLDHTHTIVHSHRREWYIRQAGSGGGWEFLRGLRHALHRDADSRAILMAEHLPNDWSLTNRGGPMDSQWCDHFHDRLVDVCKGYRELHRLAAAMQLSHTACQRWYNVTNYAESHDEVGNVNERIANVAGHGRGLRMSKVAAAACLLSRGIPMFFMGAEAGEYRQFKQSSGDALDLTGYLHREHHRKVRDWSRSLCQTRRSQAIKGPAKLEIRYVGDRVLAFSRGLGDDYFVVLNFGDWAGWKSLAAMNLPSRRYRELWNSTWPAFAVEHEDEHTNGGRHARLHRGHWLHIPDYGAVVLERV